MKVKFKKEFLDFLRKQKLQLTQKGKVIGKDVADKINFAIEKVVENLSEEDRESIYRSLKIISDNLQSLSFTK